MVAFRFGWIGVVAVLSVLGRTRAVPLADKLELLSPSARDVLKRSVPAPPHFVAYDKKLFNPVPSVSALQVSRPPAIIIKSLMFVLIRASMSCQ